MQRAFIVISALLGNKAFAATSAALLSGVSATIAGVDPFPWVLATMGMVYMLARTEPSQDKTALQIRRDALANGLVSLICGGLGGPWTSIAIAQWAGNPRLESPLLMAFLISAFWQIVAYRIWPAVWPIAQSWLQRKVGV